MTAWIQATGQGWKLTCFIMLALAGLTSATLLVLAVNGVQVLASLDELSAAGILVISGLAAFLWLSLSVRMASPHGI